MPGLTRVVAPGVRHRVSQRGRRRVTTFFGDNDQPAHLHLTLSFARPAAESHA